MEKLKYVLALTLVVSGLVAYNAFDIQPLQRTLVLLALMAAGAGVFFVSEQGKRLWHYFGECRSEVRKVVWPTRAETLQTSLMIVVVVVVLSLILWGFDSAVFALVRVVTG